MQHDLAVIDRKQYTSNILLFGLHLNEKNYLILVL